MHLIVTDALRTITHVPLCPDCVCSLSFCCLLLSQQTDWVIENAPNFSVSIFSNCTILCLFHYLQGRPLDFPPYEKDLLLRASVWFFLFTGSVNRKLTKSQSYDFQWNWNASTLSFAVAVGHPRMVYISCRRTFVSDKIRWKCLLDLSIDGNY